MKQKPLLAGCVVLALLVPGAVAVCLLLRPSGVVVTQSRVDRIQPGMTLAEVESILGGPEGNYAHDGYATFASTIVLAVENRDATLWIADTGGVAVFFDEHGCVKGPDPTFYPRQLRPWHVRLREWLEY